MKGKRKLLIPKVGPHFGLCGCGLGLGPGRILLGRFLLSMVSSKSTFFITLPLGCYNHMGLYQARCCLVKTSLGKPKTQGGKKWKP